MPPALIATNNLPEVLRYGAVLVLQRPRVPSHDLQLSRWKPVVGMRVASWQP